MAGNYLYSDFKNKFKTIFIHEAPGWEFPCDDLTFNLHLHGSSKGLLTPDRQAKQGPHVCAQKSCPRGDQHLRVRGSVRGYGVFLTPAATHASQRDTVTRQQSSHAGLAGFGRVVLPFALRGLILASAEFPMLTDSPHRMLLTDCGLWIGLQWDAGPVRTKKNDDAIQNIETGLDKVRRPWQ